MDLGKAIEKVYEWVEPHFEDVSGLQEAWRLLVNSLPVEGEALTAKDLVKIHIEKALELLEAGK